MLMLGMMAVAAVLADSINLPGIVGAFLAGLAINAAVKEHPAKAKLEFLGKALFIPVFFIATGFLIDPVAFARSIADDFPLVAGLVGTLALGKWIAAAIAGRSFGYTPSARSTVWSLTLPQVAATLAATLVAYDTFDAAGHQAARRQNAPRGARPGLGHVHPRAGPDGTIRIAHARRRGARGGVRPSELNRHSCRPSGWRAPGVYMTVRPGCRTTARAAQRGSCCRTRTAGGTRSLRSVA